MTSGPVVLMCLERENAIAHWREVMGATDPAKAAAGTIRKQFATNIERNVSHGSDADATAAFELGWFFRGSELHRGHSPFPYKSRSDPPRHATARSDLRAVAPPDRSLTAEEPLAVQRAVCGQFEICKRKGSVP